MGIGKRKGTRDARLPAKVLWMRRQRVLRRLLKKYRDAKKIDSHMWGLWVPQAVRAVQGEPVQKQKSFDRSIEAIHNEKNLKVKEKALQEQVDARKQKAAAQKEKRKLKEENKKAGVAAAKPAQ
ncbi:60S ribosomal protein L19, putative [Eimeria necatrix]|uniref:60S ribosomal protein L19, putative n=1 Tax=Eimeria necatrix TaxID=51315 RepID=U6MQG5_9EIME|nr:60S ribosomal protein L19, putative [Eimeria necatrix]CDJ64704.1 60S ribosomal protein L19, putative [Eimeria necatrix]